MGYTFDPKGLSRGAARFFLQINLAEIVTHKSDQPHDVVDF